MEAAETLEVLRRHEAKDILRFITCGSVDDGKSTLIGRLLYDSKALLDDQLTDLAGASRAFGTTGKDLDLALLVDGLQAEREQGVTIDVAYRFFATPLRKFIVADCPGHEQYTRNMVTGASTSNLAVILVDARKGMLPQTRRHSFLVSLLGIHRVVVAVNKMDLQDYRQGVFEAIATEYRAMAARMGIPDPVFVPVSALRGDNVIFRSQFMPWYTGPSLLEILETTQVEDLAVAAPFRLPVQWINRPDQDFRGFSGTVVSGAVALGDRVTVVPAGWTSAVVRIVTMDGDLERAEARQAVTIVLEDQIDVSRGDMLVAAHQRPHTADQFAAHVVWMGEEPLLPGRSYLLRLGTRQFSAQVTEIKHKVNVNTLEQVAAKVLALNEVGFCNLALDAAIPFDAYGENRETGAFILIDRVTNQTVGGGMISFPLRRAQNIHWQHVEVNKAARARLKGQKPCVLWFTGLSGSGKSTLANLVEKQLQALGRHTYLLDGDNIRHGLNKDLGFTTADRVENIRRIGECARMFVDAGLIVLTAFISPFRSERHTARELLEGGEFLEIHLSTPLEVCEQRDPKGLYRKARAGSLPNFTGIDSPYEAPEAPELRLDTAILSPDECAERVVAELVRRARI
jgi:bifunctional enzyme CysN/CysC